MSNLLEIVVTARPSWARVRTLADAYLNLNGANKVRISLLGPALSNRYGDISLQAPKTLVVNEFHSLMDSDTLPSVALSALGGSEALVRFWAVSRPEMVLVIADRTETLGVSTAAGIMQIPLIHLQGGEVSGSIDDKIRNANSKLADFHLTTNALTRQRLLSLGESPNRIEVIGCPSLDIVVKSYGEKLDDVLSKVVGIGAEISPKDDYGIVMFHPDTLNIGQSVEWVHLLLKMVAESEHKWFWFWPNPDHGSISLTKLMRRARESLRTRNVRFVVNTSPESFCRLAIGAQVMVGNSSFGIREASLIGLPFVNLGDRQAGRQQADNVINLRLPKYDDLRFSVKVNWGTRFTKSNLYGDGNAGLKGALVLSQWVPSLKIS